MSQLLLFFFIGLTFSPLGAIAAFLITYEEYTKHMGRKKAFQHGLETALFTFVIFLVISLAAGYLFTQIFKERI